MKPLRTLLFTSAALVIAVAATQAQSAPDVAGSWKLAIGDNVVCPLTLAPDGTASPADCAAGNRIARWQLAIDKLELKTASGEMVGVLLPKGDSYTGKRFSDGRKLVLSR
ncbi:MAG: AprI/Inh family metalloprotease inhibitor [Alphaproteobacteria bacterium]|nr:AprI/Inh family metalloprotease inhibitor [Alphaproteobacteria bacterium]